MTDARRPVAVRAATPATARQLAAVVDALPGFRYAGDYADGTGAVDIVVMDVDDTASTPAMITTTTPAVGGGQAPPVLAVGSFADPERRAEALTAGARGTAVKAGAPTEIGAALAEVLAGRVVIDPGVAALLRSWRPVHPGADGWTDAQRTVLDYLAAGRHPTDIATALGTPVAAVQAALAGLVDRLARG